MAFHLKIGSLFFINLSSAAEKPNIIMTDDQGYGPVGEHGHLRIKSHSLSPRIHNLGMTSQFISDTGPHRQKEPSLTNCIPLP
jgi:hypothetical protein